MKLASVGAVLAGLLLLSVTPGSTQPAPSGPVVVTGAGGQFVGYLTPVMVVEQGGTLTYANFDIVRHDVVHDVDVDKVANKRKARWCKYFKKKECPLFWSPQAGLGQQVEVKGLRNLESGEVYSFYCTLHPGMKGNLTVL